MTGPTSSAAASVPQRPATVPPGSSKNPSTAPPATPPSSSPVAPATLETYFSKSQIGIALAVIKRIPKGLLAGGTNQDIAEYLLQLRKRIVQNDPNNQNKILRHIDTCEFWKELYERIYKDNKDLQGKVRVLEERQRIAERLDSEDLGYRGDGRPRKRPAGLDEVEDWLDDEGTDPILPIGDDYLRLSSYTLRIGRQRRELERVAKNSNIPEHIDTLSTSARDLLHLLETALRDCLMPLWSLKCDDEPQTVVLFQQMMHQITLAYCSSFEALNELARTIPGRKKRFEVVNLLVTFVGEALGYLHTVSDMQAEREEDENRRLRNKRARTEESEYAVNRYLSRTLVQICQMDWKIGQLGHSEILEGILCRVLDHTGHLLSHTVFGEEVAGSKKPGNISTGTAGSETAASKFEFRYLVPILHAALGGTTRKELVARVLGDTRSLAKVTGQHGNLLLARKLMQETLVKSAVGGDVDGLKLPAPPEDTEIYSPGVSHRVEQYGSEWFLESVWALVGWELAV